jgi:hypothetical protein
MDRKWTTDEAVQVEASADYARCSVRFHGHAGPGARQPAGEPDAMIAEAQAGLTRSPAAKQAVTLARQLDASRADLARHETALVEMRDRYQHEIMAGRLDRAQAVQADIDAAGRKLAVLSSRAELLGVQHAQAGKELQAEMDRVALETRRKAAAQAGRDRTDALAALAAAAAPHIEELLRINRLLADLTARDRQDMAARATPFGPVEYQGRIAPPSMRA